MGKPVIKMSSYAKNGLIQNHTLNTEFIKKI